MQIQKGIVKYKDRSDIICTYGLTDDGKQYYFLDGNTTSNGNIVASTVLVEAIDPLVVASSIGLIEPNGNVVIPFENRSIKAISDKLLLVEKANSTTPSVVEANQLRSDPLAATRLVTTPASIKEKINSKMGSEGRFVFNDQFSEATICDLNGNNLINNEYYSFIGLKADGTIFLSKNVVDSPIMEFSLDNGIVVESAAVENNNEVSLDVLNTPVNPDVIDNAMSGEENKGFGSEDITAKDFESMSSSDVDFVNVEQPSEEVVAPLEESSDNSVTALEEKLGDDEVEVSVQQESANEEGSQDIQSEDNSIPDELVFNTEEDSQEETDGGVSSTSEDDQESVSTEENNESSENEEVQEVTSNDESGESSENEENQELVEDSENSEEVVEQESEIVADSNEDIKSDEQKLEEDKNTVDLPVGDELVAFDFADNINYDSEEKDLITTSKINDVVNYRGSLFDSDLDSDIFADSKLQVDKIINDYDMDYTSSSKDTIIEDVASTMSNLINLNRSQKQKIAAFEEKFDEISAVHKRVVERARSQVRDIENLKTKLKNYENIVTKLEAKVQLLENKVYDQEKLIANQTSELEALRPQIEGKKELVKILADAQVLLDQAA